ncbi:hypothetical protein J4216_01040 [Candidatus Woesearchaeota archaeon]|nr:hypothetical protein [Candidatus Woesearchaeota archaeon]
MKYNVDKKKVIALVLVLVAIVIVFLLTLPKDCKNNEACFNEKAYKCSKAAVITTNELDTYRYEILGKKSNSCIIKITMLEVSNTKPVEFKQALEGRSMKCAIPQNLLLGSSIKEIKNVNDYCTGPLKEAILEITIEKLYEIIVKNIGTLATEFRHLLEKV